MAKAAASIVSPVFGIGSGYKDQKKANKYAKQQGRQQQEYLRQNQAANQEQAAYNKKMYEGQQSAIRAEQERADKQLAGLKAKNAEGMARSNRRRIRGGIFGDADVNQGGGVMNQRLG